MPLFGIQPTGLLQTIFEDIGIAVAVIDREEKLVFANSTALALFGAAGIIPLAFRDWRRNYRFEDSLGNEILTTDSSVIRASRGEPVERQEIKVKFDDGSSKTLAVWAYPFSAMGMGGVFVLMVDQTVEVNLRRATTQLQRMDTLGALAAGLTHDFNNLLDSISLNADLLLREQTSTTSWQTRLNQIAVAVRKAAELVSRLMQFSRTQELHVRTVHINEIVQDVLQLVHPLIRENISVTADLCTTLPEIQADSAQIEQALVNLIVNALDAMPAGGQLKISTVVSSDPAVVEAEISQEWVVVTIADTGEGIPYDLQSTIFEPFFTTKHGKGTGLGLSSVYGIVRQHNGLIKVESAPGAGAAFTVSFPLRQIPSLSDTTAEHQTSTSELRTA